MIQDMPTGRSIRGTATLQSPHHRGRHRIPAPERKALLDHHRPRWRSPARCSSGGIWCDGAFAFCTGSDEQKQRNLDANQRSTAAGCLMARRESLWYYSPWQQTSIPPGTGYSCCLDIEGEGVRPELST
jgi:hypothetical protein